MNVWVCVFVCVCLFVCLSVCLLGHLCVCESACSDPCLRLFFVLVSLYSRPCSKMFMCVFICQF